MNTATQSMGRTIDRGVEVKSNIGDMILATGTYLIRGGLALVLIWIGAMKFSAYEAAGIQPLVANSPLLSWAYQIFSVQAFSNMLGVVEIAIGLMILARPISATVSAAGSALAIGVFLTTLSFMVSTPPVWEASLGGFPALSVAPGQFLLKDIVLLGTAVFLLGDSIKAMNRFN